MTSKPVSGAAISELQKRRLLVESRELLGAHVDRLISGVLDAIGDAAFEAAAVAENSASQNALLETCRLFESSRAEIRASFRNEVERRLDRFRPEELNKQSGPLRELAASEMSLVAPDVLETLLAELEVDRQVTGANAEELFGLDQRVSELYGVQLDGEDNPFGPAFLARCFRNAIDRLGLETPGMVIGLRVFRQVLGGMAGPLYRSLNAHLVEAGVLPRLRRNYSGPKGQGAAAGEASQTEDRRPARSASQKQPDSQGSSRAVAPASADFYRTLNDIRALTQGDPDVRDGDVALQEEVCSTSEVLDALPWLSLPAAEQPSATLDLRALLSQALAETGLNKRLGPAEARVVDAAGDLFQGLFVDPLIAPGTRTLLRQLLLPILRVVLTDESFFTDPDHAARGLVDQVARLELPWLAGKASEARELEHAASEAVGRLQRDFDGDQDVIRDTSNKVQQIRQRQQEVFARNLAAVVRLHDDEERARQAAGVAQPPTPIPTGWKGDVATMREYGRKVRRLQPGSWLQRTGPDGAPQRLQLAWVSARQDRYVCVNNMGEEVASYSRDELGLLLRDGVVGVIEQLEDSAVDRAEYATLQSLQRNLLQTTTRDPLTGLTNRRGFQQKVEAARATAARQDTTHVLCVLESNEYRMVTGTFGNEAGEQYLKELAEVVGRNLRQGDVLSRLEQDQFGLLLHGCPADAAQHLVLQHLDAAKEHHFSWAGRRFNLSLSAGMTLINDHSGDPATLLRSAATVCTVARDSGSRVKLVPQGDASLPYWQRVMDWVVRIDQALEENRLFLRGQRIAPIQDNPAHAGHYEVLLAVRDEQGRETPIGDFIRAAENFNRIPVIDRWVVRNTFLWMAANPTLLERMNGLAINISGRSLNDEYFMEYVLQQAEQIRVPLQRVCFEITETAGIANLSNAAAFITHMKGSGCMFSLDDFGSGLASYGYLKHLPVDFLKIDGAFVKSIDRDPRDLAVVRSITEIGHVLGKRVIAEHVENAAILEQLRQLGVDMVQGFHLHRPEPLDTLFQGEG